jgi:transposase
MTQTDSAPVSGAVIVGVDTHKDVHVAVALDVQGRRLGCCSVPTTSAGLLQLEQWSIRYGTVEVWVSRAPAATAPGSLVNWSAMATGFVR